MKAWMRKHPWWSLCMSMGLVLMGLALLMRGINGASCALYGMQTERETRYGAFVGCMVKTSNGWVPRAELRTAAE